VGKRGRKIKKRRFHRTGLEKISKMQTKKEANREPENKQKIRQLKKKVPGN